MATALWELYANQKVKGLLGAMRQTLSKIEKSGQSDSLWFNAMGEMAQLEKNHTVAARFFRQAFEEQNRPEYELNWGNALFYAKNYQAAKKVLTAYQEKYPEDVHGLVNLSNCYLHLNELAKVKELCNQGLVAMVAKSPLWNCLGQVAFLEKQYEQAWEYFNKAYSESPEYIDALFNRANMAYQLGRNDEALRDFAQCLRKDENYEAALLNSAVLRLEMGEWELGKESANRALKLNPNSVEALHVLGRLHLAAKEFRAARDVFRNTLKQDPDHVPTLLALAKLHIQEAEQGEAESVLKKVLAKPALLADERIASLTLLMELERYPICIQYINKLSESLITPEVKKVLLIGLWKTGKIKEAIQELEGVLKSEGETAGNLTLLGRMLAQCGAETLAETRFKKALELDSGAQGPAIELARIHLARGEGSRALAILDALLAEHPNDPDCFYNLACCHAKNLNFDDSLYNLKKAMEYGFHDLDKITADEDLNYIRQFAGYTELAGQIGFS